MVARIWHGWTTPENADAYDAQLQDEILVGLKRGQIPGYQGMHLLRRDLGDEVEFVTIMWFSSMDAIRAFVGEDYEAAVVSPKARALLSRFDARAQHYHVRAEQVM